MKNITILLPVYKLEDDDVTMLRNAVSSVEPFHNDVVLSIILPKKLKTQVNKLSLSDKLEISLIENKTTKTDYVTQVNLGIENCSTEWFSILEIDDEYNPIWLSSMNEYTKTYKDVDVFLPIIRDVNVEGKFLNFTNESLWAYGFTDTQGYLDNETLLEYQNYQTSGGLYKTETVKNLGSLKDNIKLTFNYEFLLRLTHNGVKIMGVPRIGYQHVNFRENSLFWQYKNEQTMLLSEDEVKFWLETAKKEFFFKNKREITYA